MTDSPTQTGDVSREIAPFHPETAGKVLFSDNDDHTITVDELQSLLFAANSVLMEKNDNSPEIRAVLTLHGAMQAKIKSLLPAGTQ